MADKTTHTPLEVENTAETMRDVMADLMHHTIIDQGHNWSPLQAELITVPEKRQVVDVSHYRREALEFMKPTRRKGTARLTDLQSLIAWGLRNKGETSALFANPDMSAPSLTCIADYHAEGETNVTEKWGDPAARHCSHRAVYNFPLSNEWKAWMKISGDALDKDEMGEFIEANAQDVMDPTPAILKGVISDKNQGWENRLIETAQKIEGRFGQLTNLLAMSRQFQVYETSDLKVATNRDTGESEIQFLNEHKDANGEKLKIPNLFTIAIPVFLNGSPYRMAVRFRYRKLGSKVAFILSIYNPEKVFEAAFDEAIKTATEATTMPTFMGTPES